MSHSVKIYDTCIWCTQCVRACLTDMLKMIPCDGCKAKQIASAPRTKKLISILFFIPLNRTWPYELISSLCIERYRV